MTEPYACEPSSLPQYPPTKEMDAKRRDDEARRYRCFNLCYEFLMPGYLLVFAFVLQIF